MTSTPVWEKPARLHVAKAAPPARQNATIGASNPSSGAEPIALAHDQGILLRGRPQGFLAALTRSRSMPQPISAMVMASVNWSPLAHPRTG